MTNISQIAKMPSEQGMARITDDQWREDMKTTLKELHITMQELGRELKLSKGRISQILSEGEPIPFGFPERARTAFQRIMARRAESVGLRVRIPRDEEPRE